MIRRKVKRSGSTHVKGIYISADVLNNQDRLDKVLDLMLQTGLNTAVVDMKDDQGQLATRRVRNFHRTMRIFKDNGFYLIARVVAFMDPAASRRRPTLALRRRGAGILNQARGGSGWLNPYNRSSWDYVVNIAVSAAKLGFDEIQFDQVRFPYDPGQEPEEALSRSGQASRAQTIANFLAYAKQTLEPYDVVVSADVYGAVTSTKGDSGIGQKWGLISQAVDYICPMIYPSLYPKGFYNLDQPEKQPYKVVQRSLFDAKRRNQLLERKGKQAGKIRPWLQDFSSDTTNYGLKEVQAQIRAAKQQGIHEFLLWNGYANYAYESLQVTQSKSKKSRSAKIRNASLPRTKPFFPQRLG